VAGVLAGMGLSVNDGVLMVCEIVERIGVDGFSDSAGFDAGGISILDGFVDWRESCCGERSKLSRACFEATLADVSPESSTAAGFVRLRPLGDPRLIGSFLSDGIDGTDSSSSFALVAGLDGFGVPPR
jgi:hypothetical protein